MAVLTRLTIRDFRNLEAVTAEIPAAGVVIVGENGQGKTNFLEAVYYLHLLRSVRGAKDQELVRFTGSAFYIAAQIAGGKAYEVAAAFERAGRRKRIVLDGKEVARLSEALGALPAVMVSPRDVELISGGPGERRRFLDVVLALTSRRYLVALQTYRGALERRNSALREAIRTGRGDDTVSAWEPILAEHGAVLLAERAAWVERHAGDFARLCEMIGERQRVEIRFEAGLEKSTHARDALLRALEQHRPGDMRHGVTRVGPHRDDLSITLGGQELRTFGSAGQQRTAAIALRMLEGTTLREHTASEPVLLLDDPFAELDPRRAEHILELLRHEGIGQTILAIPRPTDIPSALGKLARWQIWDGTITEDAA